MCEPTTLAVASLASSVIGGGMQYMAQKQAGAAQANAMRYQADVDRNNSIIQERLAKDAIERGKTEEKMHRIKIGQLKGQQINAFAKNGVETDSGSPLDVLSDTAMIGELEALTIRNNAEREAYGYKVQGMNYSASAANNRTAASTAKSSANTAALTSVLSTAGSVAGKWYDYKAAGAFDKGGLYGGGTTKLKSGETINWYKR